jgi:hypothetical protein
LSDAESARHHQCGARHPDLGFQSPGPVSAKEQALVLRGLRYEVADSTVVDSYYDKNPAPSSAGRTSIVPRMTTAKSEQTVRLTLQASSKTRCSSGSPIRTEYRPIYGVNASITPDAAGSSAQICDAGDAEMDQAPATGCCSRAARRSRRVGSTTAINRA